jgi:hypothetical protein
LPPNINSAQNEEMNMEMKCNFLMIFKLAAIF